ncbi:hypothetical protein CKA32_002014 [Geitlerinema sp. FC II]|nr:hypothetical protein CKA32_002014 [Geitlerinema sp. FC II]
MGKTPREINPSGIHWQRWIVRVVNELGIQNREVWRIAALLRRRVCQNIDRQLSLQQRDFFNIVEKP